MASHQFLAKYGLTGAAGAVQNNLNPILEESQTSNNNSPATVKQSTVPTATPNKQFNGVHAAAAVSGGMTTPVNSHQPPPAHIQHLPQFERILDISAIRQQSKLL